MVIAYFIKEKMTRTSSIAAFVAYVGTVGILNELCKDYTNSGGNAPLLWALTATTCFFILFLLLGYCFYAQSIMDDEIKRISKEKSKLHSKILKKRISSKNKSGR
jgi:membrane-bound metal-dependent hydrolase YbcI (DUF457 family)